MSSRSGLQTNMSIVQKGALKVYIWSVIAQTNVWLKVVFNFLKQRKMGKNFIIGCWAYRDSNFAYGNTRDIQNS